jgi:hypothetical protein
MVRARDIVITPIGRCHAASNLPFRAYRRNTCKHTGANYRSTRLRHLNAGVAFRHRARRARRRAEPSIKQKRERPMAEGKSLSQRFDDYHPSKTVLFWSCAGCIVATMIVGFSWGGWVTGGTAEDMATDALEQGRAEVAAVVCVKEFMNGAEARMQLASLKDTRSSWQRENFIEEGGWAMVAGQEYDDAAELCAERLIEMEAPPAQEAATTETGTVAQ